MTNKGILDYGKGIRNDENAEIHNRIESANKIQILIEQKSITQTSREFKIKD